MKKVFTRLREHEFYVKLSKYLFTQKRIHFIAHFIEEDRIRMDPPKVQAIQEWQPPKNIHELWSFLRLANYYRRFVKDYSKIALPLTDFAKEDPGLVWSVEGGRVSVEGWMCPGDTARRAKWGSRRYKYMWLEAIERVRAFTAAQEDELPVF